MKKMMRYISIFTVAAILLSGCVKRVDNIFPDNPDTRLQEALDAYKSTLMSEPGWKLFVYPKGLESSDIEVGGLTYYVTFPDSNRTAMVADFNDFTSETPKESSWHLVATQRPSLVFDTYSYIHIAADPDPEVSFSPAQQGGYGWGTDYDFSFTTAKPQDTLVLEGNFNHSEAMLIRATQAEIDAAFGGQLNHIIEVTDDYSSNNSFLYFPGSDNAKIGLSFNSFLKRINFTFLNSSELQTLNIPYSLTTYGVHFKFPVTAGGYTFQDMFWDEALGRYYINTGSGRADVTNSPTPLFPFYTVIGKFITGIVVPTTPLPGQSATFAAAYEDIKTNLITSPYLLELSDIAFVFDDQSKTMAMLVNVLQDDQLYVASYVYNYTPFTTSNLTKFTRISSNSNADLVENDMAPLLDYIDNDNFKVDYFTGSAPVLGQFKSQQHSDFFFTGNIE